MAGRPKKEIDQKQFENLCGLMCTEEEIASFFECSTDTIERWCIRTYNEKFADAFKKHSARGKISLRRAQFRIAEKNAAMAIFLGKNYLGQRDNIEYSDDESLSRLDAILAGLREKAEKDDA